MYANRTQDFIWGAVVGSAFAALTTLLFTTKKGKEIRDNIADKYRELEDGIKKMVGNAEEATGNAVKKVGDKINDMKK